MRLLAWVNLLFGLMLLVLVLSGIFSQVLSVISSWNQFESFEAKVIIGIAGALAVGSAAYLVFGREQRVQRR